MMRVPLTMRLSANTPWPCTFDLRTLISRAAFAASFAALGSAGFALAVLRDDFLVATVRLPPAL